MNADDEIQREEEVETFGGIISVFRMGCLVLAVLLICIVIRCFC